MWKIKNTFLNLFLCSVIPLCADTPHKVSAEQSSGLILHYTIKDLGEIDLEPRELTKLLDKPSLGPKINNDGDIVANRSTGGFFLHANEREYSPSIQGALINFHSINNQKDILISISRTSGAVDWFVWPTAQGWDGPRLTIDPVEIEGNKIYLSKVNDQQKVVGIAKPDSKSMPVEWDRIRGLYRIGFQQNENLFGTVKDINSRNTIVGKSHRQLESFPYAIINNQQFSLFKFRRHFNAPSDAKIIFADLVISDHDVVYGTYWFDKNFDDPTHKKVKHFRAFKWLPQHDLLTLLDLDGMRVTSVNAKDRLVGTRKGKAVFREADYKPIDILSTIKFDESKDWKLIEATSINDEGQIVGFGNKAGKLHLFLASPRIEPSETPKELLKEGVDVSKES